MRDPASTPEQETHMAYLYLFGVWVMLIGLAMWLSRHLRVPPGEDEADSEGG